MAALTSGSPRRRAVVYPTSDGKPMAASDKHRKLMMYFIDALTVHFADRPEIYVSGNNFLFWEEGNPARRISPDCYVVFGAGMHDRDSYKVWEEGGRRPDVIFEFTSRKTRREDTEVKRPLYERVLRVPEYFLFDPTGDYLRPRLQGYRLAGENYLALDSSSGRLHSERLGLELVQDGESVYLFDPTRQERLLTPVEQAQRAAEAERRARAVEDGNARLRAELEAARPGRG